MSQSTTNPIAIWIVFALGRKVHLGTALDGSFDSAWPSRFAAFVPGFDPTTKKVIAAVKKDEKATPAFEEAKLRRAAIIEPVKNDSAMPYADKKAVYDANPAPERPHALADIAIDLLEKNGATFDSCKAAYAYLKKSRANKNRERRWIIATELLAGRTEEQGVEAYKAWQAEKAENAPAQPKRTRAKRGQGSKASQGTAALLVSRDELQDLIAAGVKEALKQQQSE